MRHVYHIREGGGKVTESSRPEVADLISNGKLKFTGKKVKHKRVIHEFEHHSESEIVVTTYHYYVRVNRPPRQYGECTRPCCEYLRRINANQDK